MIIVEKSKNDLYCTRCSFHIYLQQQSNPIHKKKRKRKRKKERKSTSKALVLLKVPITSTSYIAFIFSYFLHLSEIYFVVLISETFLTSLHAIKEGKSGNGLIQEGVRKGNEFEAGLTSHTTYIALFKEKSQSPSFLGLISNYGVWHSWEPVS